MLKLNSLAAAIILTVFFLLETAHVMEIATEDRTAVMIFGLPACKVHYIFCVTPNGQKLSMRFSQLLTATNTSSIRRETIVWYMH